MRIHILSDLHLDFGGFKPLRAGYDLVILAGDTHPNLVGVRWAMENFPHVPVLYVAGNHEFYRDRHPGLIEEMKALAAGSNVRVLEDEGVELDGLRFFGATLWTDFALTGDVDAAVAAARDLNNFTLVQHSSEDGLFQPMHSQTAHLRTLEALGLYLKSGDASRTIVITHHAPSRLSLDDEERKGHLSAAYASNLENFILEHRPALWIHGHLHHRRDYLIGSTRVLANPRGFVGQDAETSGFDPNFIMEF